MVSPAITAFQTVLPADSLVCSVVTFQPPSDFTVVYFDGLKPYLRHALIDTRPAWNIMTSSNGLSPFFAAASSGVTRTAQAVPSSGPSAAVGAVCVAAEADARVVNRIAAAIAAGIAAIRGMRRIVSPPGIQVVRRMSRHYRTRSRPEVVAALEHDDRDREEQRQQPHAH